MTCIYVNTQLKLPNTQLFSEGLVLKLS